MKRKAPETLLEFSEYILPLKRTKFTPQFQNVSLPQQQLNFSYYEGEYRDLAYNNQPSCTSCEHEATNEDFYDDLHSSGSGGNTTRSPVSSSSSTMHDYYFDLIISDELLAKKPASSKWPLDGFVDAIKWLIDRYTLVQREVAYALSVRQAKSSRKSNFLKRRHNFVKCLFTFTNIFYTAVRAH
jgi:hypothetical protein